MKREEYERHHELLFELLCAFKYVCDKENVWYSLGYGSVLGAVRHKGFIPWDRDADVLVKLPDKAKMREAFGRNPLPGIILKNYETADRCLQSHDSLCFEDPKLRNVSLDIYFLVGAPSDKKAQDRFTLYSHFADKIIRSKYSNIEDCLPKNVPYVRVVQFFERLIPDKVLKQNIKQRETKYDFETAEFYTVLCCDSGSRYCNRKAVFDQLELMEFNGELFPVPREWDEYLTANYGDYMIPKEDW